VLYSSVTAYINNHAIPSYNINGDTMVAAEDLANYGFDVKWDAAARELFVTLEPDGNITPLEVEENVRLSGTFKCHYYSTDIKTYVEGRAVFGYNINGETLISISTLIHYDSIVWSIIITGAEYSTNITELKLNNKNLTNSDIEPLKYMINLRELELYGNNITDLTPLAGLINLRGLNLGENHELSDITPLAALTELRWLNLTVTKVVDLTALAVMENLSWLNVSNNRELVDFTPLDGLINLREFFPNINYIFTENEVT